MTDHDRRNLTFLVRMHRQLGMDLPPELLTELDAAGIDPATIDTQRNDCDSPSAGRSTASSKLSQARAEVAATR